MHAWFITTGTGGALVTRTYKTSAGMLRSARKFLDNYNSVNSKINNGTRDLEIYVASSDQRPFYNPYAKPTFTIKA